MLALPAGVLLSARAQDADGVYSKVDESPVPVRTVAPRYPASLHSEGISGIVTIQCVIDNTGGVVDPVVKKSTHPDFDKPAIEALTQWKFKPGKKDGTPVKVRVVIPFKFTSDS